MSRKPQHSHPGARAAGFLSKRMGTVRRGGGPPRRGQISGTKGTPQAERPSAAMISRSTGAGFMRTVLACAPAICAGSLRSSLAATNARRKAPEQRPAPRGRTAPLTHGPAHKYIYLTRSCRSAAKAETPARTATALLKSRPKKPFEAHQAGAVLLRRREKYPLTQGDPLRLDTLYR